MRHLPPGTVLPRPSDPVERALLAELLRLPDATDPFQWLREERGPLIARITLWRALAYLRQVLRSARRGETDAGAPSPRTCALVGDLLRLPADTWSGQIALGAGIATTPPAALRDLFDRVRALRGTQPRIPPASPAHGDLEQLLADLQELPAGSDPLRWLQEERGEVAAYEVLFPLIEQSHPAGDSVVGPARRSWRLKAGVRGRRSRWWFEGSRFEPLASPLRHALAWRLRISSFHRGFNSSQWFGTGSTVSSMIRATGISSMNGPFGASVACEGGGVNESRRPSFRRRRQAFGN